MTKAVIIHRLNVLLDVTRWSIDNKGGLTPGQRICVSQERAALMHCLDEISETKQSAPDVRPRYQIPAHLEAKVQHIYNLLNRKK